MNDPVETIYDLLYNRWSLGAVTLLLDDGSSADFNLSKTGISWKKHNMKPPVSKPTIFIKRGQRVRRDKSTDGYLEEWKMFILPLAPQGEYQDKIMWSLYDEADTILLNFYDRPYGDCRRISMLDSGPQSGGTQSPSRDYEIGVSCTYEKRRPG